MQVYGSPYKSTYLCFRETLRNEGAVAFYRSYTTQVTMNIPFQVVTVVTYEFVKDLLNPENNYDPKSHVIAGSLAGAIAACVTNPLDVCKTLLNTQEQCARTQSTYVTGMVNALRTVYRFRGMSGFYRGLTARVCYQVPSTGISWSCYEFFKYIISKKQSIPDDRYLTSVQLKQQPLSGDF